MSSMLAIYVAVCLAPVNGQIYFLANDAEQAESRGFKIAGQILRASPLLRGAVDISSTRITLRQTGTTIVAVANDYAGFSGADPTLNIYDELAYFNSESSRRLWDEGIPSPRRPRQRYISPVAGNAIRLADAVRDACACPLLAVVSMMLHWVKAWLQGGWVWLWSGGWQRCVLP
jgi:phage terminase large subunit-like protein